MIDVLCRSKFIVQLATPSPPPLFNQLSLPSQAQREKKSIFNVLTAIPQRTVNHQMSIYITNGWLLVALGVGVGVGVILTDGNTFMCSHVQVITNE